MTKPAKVIIKMLLISCMVYLLICFVLIYWPAPSDTPDQKYDYSSIKKDKNILATAEEHWMKMRDGATLFTRIYPAESDQVLVLIHGSGSESRYLSDLGASLAQAGVATVITPDMRGHGRSDGQKGEIDYIGQLEDDLDDIIEYCHKERRADKVILAGHSSGGGLVVRYLGNLPEAIVHKAVFLAPYLGYDAPTVRDKSGGWVTVAVKRWIGLSMLNQTGISGWNNLPVLFFNRPQTYQDSLLADHYSYSMAVNFAPDDYRKDIKAINIPSYVIVGEHDESFFPDEFRSVFSSAQSDVKTKIIPQATHLGIVSNEETKQLMIKWLKK